VLARCCVAPLIAVMVIACASETPRSATPLSRSKAGSVGSGARATPQGERTAPPAASNTPLVREDSDALAARFRTQAALARFTGQASYYSDALAGRPTASGEPYEPSVYTAAHRSLPFGTIVRVVSDQTGRTVYVRINDRGPFVRGRVLDLSRAAAQKLGLIGRGVLNVRAEIVENGPVKKSARRRIKRRHKSKK
jgi:rare lipoprotein A